MTENTETADRPAAENTFKVVPVARHSHADILRSLRQIR